MRPSPAEAVASTRPGRKHIKILFLAANALREQPLRLDEELRTVDRRLRAARFRDAFQLVSCSAVRLEDVQQSLLEHAPDVVHFAGHGDGEAGLVLSGEDGRPVRLPAAALASLFAALRGPVRLVVFNACSSAEHAAALREGVEFAIGMGGAIDDRASLGFAGAFYEALAYGCSVRKAFECGVAAVKALSPAQAHLPELYDRSSVDADVAFFDPSRRARFYRTKLARALAGATFALGILGFKLTSSAQRPPPADVVDRCRKLVEGRVRPEVATTNPPTGDRAITPGDLVAQLATLHRLADSYRRARQSETYDLAEPLYLCVLDLRADVLGGDHLDTAKTLAGLGLLYAHRGDAALAEPRLVRAKDLFEQAQRPPPELIDVLHALADLAKGKGETDREQAFLLRALEIKVTGPGGAEARAETATRLDGLVQRYRDEGDVAKADALRDRLEAFRRAASPVAMARIAGGVVRVGALDAAKRPNECTTARLDETCPDAARPDRVRTVELAAFELDVTEVTNEAFARWLDDNADAWYLDAKGEGLVWTGEQPPLPFAYANDACEGGLIATRADARQGPDSTRDALIGPDSGNLLPEGRPVRVFARAGTEHRPAVCVTWQGASNYCRAQGKRLPSEAEWQLAAKGAQGRPFPWGSEPPQPANVAFGGEAYALSGPRDVATSRQDRTPEGAFDLGGNVAEWTQDEGPAGNVVRGASWASTRLCPLSGAGCSLRATTYATDLGFRCARPSPQTMRFR